VLRALTTISGVPDAAINMFPAEKHTDDAMSWLRNNDPTWTIDFGDYARRLETLQV
jgi:hypothetical protein